MLSINLTWYARANNSWNQTNFSTSKMCPNVKFLHIQNFSTSKISPHLEFLHMTRKFSMDNIRGVRDKYQVWEWRGKQSMMKWNWKKRREDYQIYFQMDHLLSRPQSSGSHRKTRRWSIWRRLRRTLCFTTWGILKEHQQAALVLTICTMWSETSFRRIIWISLVSASEEPHRG